MEQRDLYDKNKNLTGKKIFKGEAIPENYYCLVVMIFMEDEEGNFLIQKRSKAKGGKWAMTGGHPKTGESSFRGLITEVKEELGLDISKEKVRLIKTKVRSKIISDLYYVKMNIDIKKIVCQEEEVSDVKLASINEIKEMIKNGDFHKAHGEIFLDNLDLITHI